MSAGHDVRRPIVALLAAVTVGGSLLGGCAVTPPLPGGDFDPARVRVVPSATAPTLDVSGLPGGKAVGAGVGAGTGFGAGAAVGGTLCLATGPFFALCLAALLPTTGAIGAVAGGLVGAVHTEGLAARTLKTKLLTDELAATPYQERMAEQIRQHIGIGTEAALNSDGAAPWTLDVAVVEVGTEGSTEYALRLVTRLRLRQGDAPTVWQVAREVQSDTELTTAQWLADDAKALHTVLDLCIAQGARRLATEFARSRPDGSGKGAPRSKYSSSCDDPPLQDSVAAGSPPPADPPPAPIQPAPTAVHPSHS